MKLASENFLQEANTALNAKEKVARRNLLGQFLPLARDSAASKYGDFDELRAHMKRVRRHTSEHLSHYLQQFEEAAVQHGNQVHFVADAEQLNSKVLSICQAHSARRVAKGKSMVTEETGLNELLLKAGLEQKDRKSVV